MEVSVPVDAPDAVRRMETGVSVVKALLIPPADDQDQLERQLVNISSYGTHDSAAKQDCYNPKCAILRVEQNHHQQSGPIPKAEDVLSMMHMYELLNRIRIANSSLTGNQSKAQEIGNRMCASIGVRSPSAATCSSTTYPLLVANTSPTHNNHNNQNYFFFFLLNL
ncbi:hypothetical protein B9Z55_012353 [Caenorhabditis nigoni]|uniref:Uncharacterized protein n=1 Tax=Caenorhabditis nigoni TaxID=1611254 RepID=A0A2G5TXD8_9PELO|nr:hypothetical protein B9Z55_012353 [Caenorhabditis nigoni]